MGIAGFPSLWMPLNLAEPAYLEHVSSVFIFSLRVCERNWPLCIGPLQFLNSSLYWSSRKTQSFYSLDQVKQFILGSGSFSDKGSRESSSSLYNKPYRGESILYPETNTFPENLTTTMVDVPPPGSWLLIIYPSGAEYSIRIDSCFSSSEKKLRTDWLPHGDNQSSKSWSRCPWSRNSPFIRFARFNYLLIESFQHRYIENSLKTQFPCEW